MAPLFANGVRFWSFLLSHVENDRKRILQKETKEKQTTYKVIVATVITVSRCFVLRRSLLLLSLVSVEPEDSWTL